MNSFDPKEINRLIATRRSIFPGAYSEERVDDSIVKQMLENAHWAPNHGLTEPWMFTVFTEGGLQKLAHFQSELYEKLATARGDFDPKLKEKLKIRPLQASHVISIGMKRDSKKKYPEVEEIEAVACAVQNMYLTATAYGVGCYWSTYGVTYEKEANSFFNLSDEDQLLGFLFIGMPKGNWPNGRRSPVEEKYVWVSEE